MIRDWRVMLGLAGVIVAALLTALVVNQAAQRDRAMSALITAQHKQATLRAQNVQEQRELVLLLREVAALSEQVRRMGGKPVVVVTEQPSSAPSSSSPQPRPTASPTRSHRPSPTPTPTCVFVVVCS